MKGNTVEYSTELYTLLRKTKRAEKEFMFCDLELAGTGAAGSIFTAYVRDKKMYPEPIILKEHDRNRFSINETEALKLIRRKMVTGEWPGYYIFMYGSFCSGDKKYLVLEKADKCVDDYLTDNKVAPRVYFDIFWHIADAVEYLESQELNHGDLWSENVMLKWRAGQELLPEAEREFDIKIIDFDSAFMTNSQIKHPSLGGANRFREQFILGYDLDRFFDGLLYSYNQYIKKRKSHQKRHKLRSSDSSLEEFDQCNIVYPPAVLKFMRSLKPTGPDDFRARERLSGTAVKRVIEKILGDSNGLDK